MDQQLITRLVVAVFVLVVLLVGAPSFRAEINFN